MDWKDCLKKSIAKEVQLDENLISSLIRTSENKLKSSDELLMNETTASSKVILAYDSLREILEALALQNGYKIYNHECYTSFIKEILKNNLSEEFDDIRLIRNDLNYYGKEIEVSDAENIIERIKILRRVFLKGIKQK